MADVSSLPIWAIVLFVFGALLGTFILIVTSYCFWRLYKRCTEPVYACKSFAGGQILDISREREHRTREGEHVLLGRPLPSCIDIIPTGETAEPLQPLDWPPPSPPPEVEI